MAYYVGQLRRNSASQSSTSYMTNISLLATDTYSESPFGESNKYYQDYAIYLPGSEIPGSEVHFEVGEVYYLRFKILKIPMYFYSGNTSQDMYKENYEDADKMSITVELRNKSQSDGQNVSHSQVIGYYNIPSAFLDERTEGNNTISYYKSSEYENTFKESPYSSFTVIFSPNEFTRYNMIVFRMRRNTYDAIERPYEGPEGHLGEMSDVGRTWLSTTFNNNRYPQGETEAYFLRYKDDSKQGTVKQKNAKIIIDKPTIVFDSSYINNENVNFINPKSEDYIPPSEYGQFAKLTNIVPNSSSPWIKLGYQSRPGSLIVINKEPIRVGRSGIFELDNKLPIKDVRIANPGGSKSNNNIDAFLLDYAYSTKN